jgi:demethylmenaquinone methyltransferase/2-methoxy-6-polyprenyl-1,4-benzoquinol methylase
MIDDGMMGVENKLLLTLLSASNLRNSGQGERKDYYYLIISKQKMKNSQLFPVIFTLLACNAENSFGFVTKTLTNNNQKMSLPAAKGFGTSKSPNQPKKQNKKAILKQLQKTYGGTSPEEIARGTQRIIDQRLKGLPPHFQIAIQLYQQLQQWNYRIDGMDLLRQAKLPEQEVEGARRAQEELDRLMKEHNFSKQDLHNLLQVATWDASADAKAARSIAGKMPIDIERKVQKGCDLVGEAVGEDGKCLDVGCGYGVLTPYLRKAGISSKRIYGIDLSSEMIRNAESLNPGANYEAGDFFTYNPHSNFEAILFCSSLHDLPDPILALKKATSLLNENGKVVIVHAQGASHVQTQARANPVLVQRGLPTISELQAIDGMNLIVEPASANSQQESKSGYLAVLQKL